jgi:RNA polymerase sigma-70 factor (ECF subfamily)
MHVDEKTISECKRNNSQAQKAVYEAYAPIVLAVCRRYVADRDAAEDVMQETFITVFTKISQYKGLGSFEGWIRRIAVNAALLYLRKRKLTYEIDENISDEEFENEADRNRNDERGLIERAGFSAEDMIDFMSELPIGFRTVLNLFAVEGLKHKDIAELMHISENTSKTQFLRARKRFQDVLIYKAKLKLGIRHNTKL